MPNRLKKQRMEKNKGRWSRKYAALKYCRSFLIAFEKIFLYVHFMPRKPLSTRVENNFQKKVKKLAIDLERPLNDILEEAIEDLLKKYEKKRKK